VIVRDDLLIEVARRSPKSPQDFSMIRGLAHKFLDEFFAIYQRVLKMPAEELPHFIEREQESPQLNLVGTLLGALLPDFAARRKVAPGLVATAAELRGLVKAFAAGRVSEFDGNLTRGWRASEVLPHFLAVLEGRLSLRVADVNRDAPLEYREWSDR
jgi:ribonuclease D